MKVKLIVLLLSGVAGAAEYPQAGISNGQIRATLNLPDPQRGYYRGTRFDWSGVIASLEYKGHTYFEPFYEKFDKDVRDVDLKNGVGVLRKPNDSKYDHYYRYEIADPGKWTVKKGSDWIRFTQEVNDPASG